MDSDSAHWEGETCATCSEAVEIQLTRLIGDPFVVHMEIDSRIVGYNPFGWLAYNRVNAQLRFADLPVGAIVLSCQGYGTDWTPIVRTSWGKLKTIYR